MAAEQDARKQSPPSVDVRNANQGPPTAICGSHHNAKEMEDALRAQATKEASKSSKTNDTLEGSKATEAVVQLSKEV